jgi:hypothetical protein
MLKTTTEFARVNVMIDKELLHLIDRGKELVAKNILILDTGKKWGGGTNSLNLIYTH